MFVRVSLRGLKAAAEVLGVLGMTLIQAPLYLLQKLASLMSGLIAWSKSRPVTLAETLKTLESAPFHRWAKMEEVDDEGMTGNEYLAAEELVRNALFGESTNASLTLVSILNQQAFDSDEIEEMLTACRKGDIWALRRTVDWVADYIDEDE